LDLPSKEACRAGLPPHTRRRAWLSLATRGGAVDSTGAAIDVIAQGSSRYTHSLREVFGTIGPPSQRLCCPSAWWRVVYAVTVSVCPSCTRPNRVYAGAAVQRAILPSDPESRGDDARVHVTKLRLLLQWCVRRDLVCIPHEQDHRRHSAGEIAVSRIPNTTCCSHHQG